jgi:hypothetical protein
MDLAALQFHRPRWSWASSMKGNIGGDFHAKWLGADAVGKLLVSDASASTFEQELCHPNVLKLYGVCQAAPNVNFFACEYASQVSLAESATAASSSSSSVRSNILIVSDGMVKLSNFGSTGVANHPRCDSIDAPEVPTRSPASRESDVYSLGMCIREAESGKRP